MLPSPQVRHDRSPGQHLLDSVFAHLNLIETAYFGLRYQDGSNQTVRKGKREALSFLPCIYE